MGAYRVWRDSARTMHIWGPQGALPMVLSAPRPMLRRAQHEREAGEARLLCRRILAT